MKRKKYSPPPQSIPDNHYDVIAWDLWEWMDNGCLDWWSNQ